MMKSALERQDWDTAALLTITGTLDYLHELRQHAPEPRRSPQELGRLLIDALSNAQQQPIAIPTRS
jgi:hypothetical protein